MTKREDGRWQESIMVNGKRKYFYGKTKAEVVRKIRDYQDAQGGAVLFKHVAEEWADRHREEIGDKTWINYKPHYDDIVSQHGDTPVDEMSALDVINDLKRCVAQGRSATIISTRRSLYRMILDHAVVQGHIKVNPAVGVAMPKKLTKKRREAPDDTTLKIILANTDKPFGLFPALLACTGMRKAEALALTWGDIKADSIVVSKALDFTVQAHPTVKSPKTKAGEREVPIIDVLKPLLSRPKGAADSDLLFPALPSNRNPGASGHMTERQYEGEWIRYCQSVGLVNAEGKPTITAHNLRHGMATLLFESGADELTAQAILGHASPTTTRNIYTHLRQQQRVKSVGALNDTMSNLMSTNLKPLQDKEI